MMKINRFLIGIIALFFVACVKDEVDKPTFDTQEKDIVINAGDSLQFNLKGDANIVTFYSGEPGSIYAYKERTQKELEGKVELSFATRVMNGYELPREVDVLVSTDFNGKYIYDDVSAANWINISDKFAFSSTINGSAPTGLTPSGTVDVTDLLVPGKPFYVAFRYTSLGVPPGPRMNRQWRIELFSLVNEYAAGFTVLANQSTAGWSIVSKGGVDAGRGGTIQSNRLNFFANNKTLDVGLEEWGITQEVDLFKVEPDKGIAIKNTSENRLESYSHIYNTPGTYKAVFVAANSNIYGHQAVVREVNVVVKP